MTGLGVVLCLGMTGCGSTENSQNSDEVSRIESMPNPGERAPNPRKQEELEESSLVGATASTSRTLYYEGACWWLKCANGNSAEGACRMGCDDTRKALARDYSWRLSCGQSLKVVANGRSVYATVWDQSCCERFEGTDALLDALAIPHGDGTCSSKYNFTYGWGQAPATFYY